MCYTHASINAYTSNCNKNQFFIHLSVFHSYVFLFSGKGLARFSASYTLDPSRTHFFSSLSHFICSHDLIQYKYHVIEVVVID